MSPSRKDDRSRPAAGAAAGPDGERKSFFRLAEIAARLGVKKHVIKYWESAFKLVEPMRVGTRRNLYTGRDLEIFTEIKRLVHDERYTVQGARRKLVEGGFKPKRGSAGRRAAPDGAAGGSEAADGAGGDEAAGDAGGAEADDDYDGDESADDYGDEAAGDYEGDDDHEGGDEAADDSGGDEAAGCDGAEAGFRDLSVPAPDDAGTPPGRRSKPSSPKRPSLINLPTDIGEFLSDPGPYGSAGLDQAGTPSPEPPALGAMPPKSPPGPSPRAPGPPSAGGDGFPDAPAKDLRVVIEEVRDGIMALKSLLDKPAGG